MTQRGCLGIDESNHGRFPEIFVAVYSENLGDLVKRKLKKKRGSPSIFRILNGRDFKYLVVPKEYKTILGQGYDSKIKSIAFFELSRAFSEEKGGLETVLIDGDINRPTLDRVKHLAYPTKFEIRAVRNGDLRIPLVNLADQVANILYRSFKSQKPLNPRLSKHLITSRLEDFRGVLY